MGNFSDKVKIVYLTFVIFFALGVLAYLLDTWGVINMEEYIPFLEEESPLVAEDADEPGLLEWERLEKEQIRIEEERIKLEEERLKLEETLAAIKAKEEELVTRERGVSEEKQQIAEGQAARFQRQEMIRDMATRMTNMPPQDAVAIMAGFSNTDLVDVLLQMEANAVQGGGQSIVPFLMTLLPRDRAALLGTLMMDEEARRLPRTDIGEAESPTPMPGEEDPAPGGEGEAP
jgi:flagellar protein FlbB